MKLLLDTHIFLWYFGESKRLDPAVSRLISAEENDVYLSVVSLWEAIIKFRAGKLPLPQSPEILFPVARNEHGIRNLDLSERSVQRIAALPLLHHDPFDRALIAQALSENMTIVTVDSAITQYPVSVL